MRLNFYLLPNNYILNGVGLTIRMNEDDCLNEDCLNPMSIDVVTSCKMYHFDTTKMKLNQMGNNMY